MESKIFSEERRRNLRDEPCASELYGGLPTVEEARRDEDPILWIKARNLCGGGPEDGEFFFVAGCTRIVPEGFPFIVGIGELTRGGDVRFYGLVVEPYFREMGWGEITTDELDWEGPGCPILVVDEAWKPRRFSQVMTDYPEHSFREGLAWPWPEARIDHHRAMIDEADFGTVRRNFEHLQSEIREVILVGAGGDLAEIAAQLDYPADVRSSRGLELARRGAIRFAVARPGDVPEPWTPFATRLDEIPPDRWCEVIYAPPAYLVQFAG